MVRRLILSALLCAAAVASAAQYRFQVTENTSVLTVLPDGNVRLEYTLTFANSGQPIDIVDVGFPDARYEAVTADLDGVPMEDIRPSEYVTYGVEVHLGDREIPSGSTGTLHVSALLTERLFPDDDDPNLASLEFQTTWYGSEFTSGTTALSCSFVFPEGVGPDDVRWHDRQPAAGIRDDGRVVYTWSDASASPSSGYTFGASFPRSAVARVAEKPSGPGFFETLLGLFFGAVESCFPCLFFALFPTVIAFSVYRGYRRKMKYLPATVGMTGVEVRRGLTVPEVAVLMEEKVDRVMALALFGLIRKEALRITSQKPLRLQVLEESKAQFSYEKEFLKAVENDGKVSEAEAVRVLKDLVKKVEDKMKGYSRKRTLIYYRDIMRRAWDQVGSEDYSQAFEWLLLDENFGRTARERYGERPIPVPYWWTTVHHGGVSGGGSRGPGGGTDLTSAAHQIVSGFEGFGRNLVNSVPGLASKVTATTNPVPVATGGGCAGGGCACACACAGCACACAGGGR